MLKLKSVQFQYNADSTLYDFTLQLKAGTIAGVSGRSGCGKSTLLDLIAGFQIPSHGTLHWNNRNFTSLAPEKRPVTTVFQSNNLFEHRNALDNVIVGINPKIPKSGSEVTLAKEALDTVELSDFAHTRVSLLSGGQQQRVALARAILRQSQVILLDEPFSALDQQTRHSMLTLIRKLATEKQRAIVMVTHDLRDCSAVADQHYIIEKGSLHLQP